VRSEIHAGAVLEEIVEGRAAAAALQPVDAAEPAIIEHDDVQLLAEQDRGRDLWENRPSSSAQAITVALAGDGQRRDDNKWIASEHATDADNHRRPAVQHNHRPSVRIGVAGFMRPVVRD